MKFNYNSNIFLFFLLIYFIFIQKAFCITEEILNSFDEKITDANLEIEVLDTKKILKEYDDLNKKFKSLIEREKKERKRKTFNEQKFKDEYKKMENEATLFKKYFYKQRSKMSKFIEKPKKKIDKETMDVYHLTVEYSLEAQDLINEIGKKINVNKEDL